MTDLFIIKPQSFELIRDRLAEILTTELPLQAAMANNPLINAEVFKERFVPLNHTESPAVNVYISDIEYYATSTVKQKSQQTYFIDVYSSGASTSTERGDTQAMTNLHRLLAVIKGIIADNKYTRLGFDHPMVMHRSISGIKIKQPDDKGSESSVMGRVIVEVKCMDDNSLPDASVIQSITTEVEPDCGDNSYIWQS